MSSSKVFDSDVISAYGVGGLVTGLVLLFVGIAVSLMRRHRGIKHVWIAIGASTVPIGWFLAFPLSNRDAPLSWFIVFFLVYGGGLGVGLMGSVSGKRPN